MSMVARESIGHVLYHQTPPHDRLPVPTRPVSELSTPNSHAEACADEYAAVWGQAMDKEYRGLAIAGTFGEMRQPDGLNAISVKWVLARKPNEHSYVVRAQTRLVALGFSSGKVLFCFRLSPRRPAASCFRFLGAVACELGLDVCRFDSERAFLQSSLEGDLFMRLPPGYGKMSSKIVRLNRSLHGLKQELRSGHGHLTTHISDGSWIWAEPR